MEYALAYDSARRIATATPSGEFDLVGGVEMTEALVGDDRYERGMDLLFDGTSLDLSTGTGADMRRLAETLSRLAPLIGRPRIAIVGSGDLGFGLGRMIEACAHPDVTIGVFRDRGEALVWLGGFSALERTSADPT